MRIELITVGDELLIGFTIDTNAAFLARELATIGVTIVRHATVGDNESAIADSVRDAISRTGAVITTGGLGPTDDDRTRPAVAALFGRELEFHQEILEDIARRFRAHGYNMPSRNSVQALVPRGARVLPNQHGTAPGLVLEDEQGRWVAMLPGVPRELRGMMADHVIPMLMSRTGPEPRIVSSRTLRTTGIGESALAERLGGLAREVDGLLVASLPGWEGTDLRLTTEPMPRAAAEASLAAAIHKLRGRAGRYAYGEDTDDLAAIVLALCRERTLHIACAESCTGGMLGARLSAIPGAGDVFAGGVIAYANEAKTAMLGVPEDLIAHHGAVSEAVSSAMARGVRERFATQVGVGITGIAGPDGGSPEKPVGTVWIAVDTNESARTLRRVYVGDREEIRRRACQSSLDLIRRELLVLDGG